MCDRIRDGHANSHSTTNVQEETNVSVFTSSIGRIGGGLSRRSAAEAAGKRGKKKGLKRCKQQAAQCQAFVAAECEGNEECIARQGVCCAPLAQCDVNASLNCFFFAEPEDPGEV